MTSQTFDISTFQNLSQVAEEISTKLNNKIVFLKGNLGAGKTTFVQELVAQLGSKDSVSSPSYSIVNEYIKDNETIYHFDLYRLKNIEEVYEIGIEDYLNSQSLCLIEWPEIFEEEITEDYSEIQILNDQNQRTLIFTQ